MNIETSGKANTAKGAKLLAILAVGAASGGCFLYQPGDKVLGISPEDAKLFQAAHGGSSDSSDDSSSQPSQQQQ